MYLIHRCDQLITSFVLLQGAFPEVFHGAANSIVCLHETSMLHDIFNQTAPPVRSIRFAPKRCRTSIAKCEQCLTSQRCQLLGELTLS